MPIFRGLETSPTEVIEENFSNEKKSDCRKLEDVQNPERIS